MSVTSSYEVELLFEKETSFRNVEVCQWYETIELWYVRLGLSPLQLRNCSNCLYFEERTKISGKEASRASRVFVGDKNEIFSLFRK